MSFSKFARRIGRSTKKRLGISVAPNHPIEIPVKPPRDILADFIDRLPNVLQYRKAYFEMRGHVAPGLALPTARSWPEPDDDISYTDKLTRHLNLSDSRGAEIGPLNIPSIDKEGNDVVYVDHLDTVGLREKYPGLSDIVEIDRPMINGSLADTLRHDGPLDYLLASQVFEHVPNPIRWLREISEVLRVGGLLAISLPDRRMTFDLYREESSAADMVAAFYADALVPDVRAVFDNQLLAATVNMHWLFKDSMSPDEVFEARGARSPAIVNPTPLHLTELARDGVYLDAHCWVFTPPGFLIVMSQLAESGFLPFRCRQFYPTNEDIQDRGNHSFTVILEKVPDGTGVSDIRRSFLMALGD